VKQQGFTASCFSLFHHINIITTLAPAPLDLLHSTRKMSIQTLRDAHKKTTAPKINLPDRDVFWIEYNAVWHTERARDAALLEKAIATFLEEYEKKEELSFSLDQSASIERLKARLRQSESRTRELAAKVDEWEKRYEYAEYTRACTFTGHQPPINPTTNENE
jgi:hypothetical protein